MTRYYPVTKRRTRVVQVPIGDGDRDISWSDSADIADNLAGTLGPVQTEDSSDVADALDAGPLQLGDTADNSDAFGPIEGPVLLDSVDVSDNLAGTLGPVQTEDSTDLTAIAAFGPIVVDESADASEALGEISGLSLGDSAAVADELAGMLGPIQTEDSADIRADPVIGPAVVNDSASVTAVTRDTDLDVTALDSLDLADRLQRVLQMVSAAGEARDVLAATDLTILDSAESSDQINDIALSFLDAFTASNTANAQIEARAPESGQAIDGLDVISVTAADSHSASDERGTAVVTTARLWPNAVVSNSGFNNTGNTTDLNEATGSTISATQSGGLLGGSSQNANGNIQVSAPNLNVVPPPTIANAQIQAGWTTTSSGGLQSGNSVNVALEYSLNEGASWINLQTVTNTAGTGNPTANIAVTYAQIQQLRFRAVGSVSSGTTVLVGGANQTFTIRYFRLQFDLSQSL